jgi:hypothetical protein
MPTKFQCLYGTWDENNGLSWILKPISRIYSSSHSATSPPFMNIHEFYDVRSFRSVNGHRHFGIQLTPSSGNNCPKYKLHLQTPAVLKQYKFQVPADGVSALLRTVGNYLSADMVSHPRRFGYSQHRCQNLKSPIVVSVLQRLSQDKSRNRRRETLREFLDRIWKYEFLYILHYVVCYKISYTKYSQHPEVRMTDPTTESNTDRPNQFQTTAFGLTYYRVATMSG